MSVQTPIVIPDKIYFTIGEVAKLCQLEPHVLRYWEQEFPQLNPSKRRKRRYYQRNDIKLVCKIKKLLYEDQFSIRGARKQLETEVNTKASSPEKKVDKTRVQSAIEQLEELLDVMQ